MDDTPGSASLPGPASRLDLLKALGDNTRYAIYLELARAASPKSTSDIADTLGLHPNTVRPHLERMREVGLLDVRPDLRGGVGRPQHVYSLAAGAPGLGLEPPVIPLLARMLLRLARDAGIDGDAAADIGREQGRADAIGLTDALDRLDGVAAGGSTAGPLPCVEAAMIELEALGFDPARVDDAQGTTVAFTHCPFRELAELHPEVVCNLHRGILEGFVSQVSESQTTAAAGAAGTAGTRVEVRDFHTLAHHQPCQAQLTPLDPVEAGAA